MARSKAPEWITEEGLAIIEGWAREGLTNEEIASNIGIGIRTLYDWRKKYPQLAHSLKTEKKKADTIVENALYKRCIGYDYEETRKRVRVVRKGSVVVETQSEEYTVTRHVPPDPTSIAIWLNNRKPKQWRQKRDYVESSYEDKLQDVLARIDEAMD